MKNLSQLTEVLNDLLLINVARIKAYEKAVHLLDYRDGDLKVLFSTMVFKSHTHVSEIENLIWDIGGEVHRNIAAGGKIFRSWEEMQCQLCLDDRKGILASSEIREDSFLEAYNASMEFIPDIPIDIRLTLLCHRTRLMVDLEQVQSLRDVAEKIA